LRKVRIGTILAGFTGRRLNVGSVLEGAKSSKGVDVTCPPWLGRHNP